MIQQGILPFKLGHMDELSTPRSGLVLQKSLSPPAYLYVGCGVGAVIRAPPPPPKTSLSLFRELIMAV